MTAVWAIYKKELYSYFVSPLFYVAATVFLALAGFYFHSDLAFYAQFGLGQNVLGHFWQVLFMDMRMVLMITAPLLTMRLLAEERKTGSLEILYTSPVTELEILLGKFGSSLSVLLLLLACTLSFPAYLYSIQPHSTATVAAGYTGLILLGAAFLGCGLLLSSLTESQTVAGLGSVGLLILLWALDWNEGVINPSLRDFIKGASLMEHFTLFANGVIDARDVCFYLFFTLLFGYLTLRVMESRRWGGGDIRAGFPYLRTAVEVGSLCALWLVVQMSLGANVFRIDLTTEQAYSLSPRSKRILQELDRNIELVGFFEDDDKRAVAVVDLFRRISAETPRVRYRVLSANRNPGLAREYGVRTAGAIVVSAENAKGHRIATDFSEPVLFQAILQASEKFAQKIYFVSGHGERDISSGADQRRGYTLASSLLQQELYQVESLSLRGDAPIPADSGVVVIAGPTAEFEKSELDKLDKYLQARGVLLVLLDPGGSESLAQFLLRYGIEAPNSVVVDTDARLTTGEPWTFRVTGRPTTSAILSQLQLDPVFSVSRPLRIKDNRIGAYVLLASSPESQTLPWTRGSSLDKSVFGMKESKEQGPFVLGIQVILDSGEQESGGPRRVGRLVVYGDSDFADNYFLDLLGNRDLLGNTVHWLAKEASFADIRSDGKTLSAQQFFITAAQLRNSLWLGIVIQPALFALLGMAVFTRFKMQ